MKNRERERVRVDIAEAFDFVRFLVKHPETLRKIRNGSDIRIIPSGAKAPESLRLARRTQTFAAERVFRNI